MKYSETTSKTMNKLVGGYDLIQLSLVFNAIC